MSDLNSFIQATVDVSRGLLARSNSMDQITESRGGPKLLVPIRSLGENHRTRIAAHLLALDERDRYLRFGYAAKDTQIQSYVAQLNFERDEIFGIYNRRLQLIAVAHLAMSVNAKQVRSAEFGVSVISKSRGRGLGARLFERAALSASNAGIEIMFIQALNENAAMLSIARKAGAIVERDGAESEAYLKLPTGNLDTQLAEIIAEQAAQIDYQIKLQAKQFCDFLADLKDVRRSTEDDQRIDGS